MKKIINKLKNNSLFTFILGIILCGGVVYGINAYNANDILYTTSDGVETNVNDAINSLYDMKQELENIKSVGDATAADIKSGKTAVVQGTKITGTLSGTSNVIYLGTGVSFNVSNVAGYQNFTAANFIVGVTAIGNLDARARTNNEHRYVTTLVTGFSLSKSYNASTGVLTVSGTGYGVTTCNDDAHIYCGDAAANGNAIPFAYLVNGPIN